MPQTRIMQEQFDNNDALPKVVDTIDVSKSKVWERRIAIVFIVAALVGLLTYTGLLTQAYITHKPAFELLGYGSSKPGFELLAYSSEVLLIFGCLAQIIALSISILIDTERKQLGYISTLIGAVLLLLSFGLFFISHQPEQGWWRYFSTVTFGTGYITMNLSKLVGAERKRLRDILQFITFLLWLVAVVLQIYLSGA